MTMHKTLTVPKATKHLRLDLAEPIPAGTVDVVLSFPVSGEDDEEGFNLHPTTEQIAAAMAGVGKGPPEPCYATLEEAIAAAERQVEAAEADPSRYSLKEFHGIWKDSKAWGKHVDIEAEIRKMRDEWPDYWGVKDGKA
ncbi:hypothetical protein AGMMS4952_07760 [Spirochaetia bacterium]|nr:hypothetical protein AGMMS4952_07760 [Spirochaetia bacterium]